MELRPKAHANSAYLGNQRLVKTSSKHLTSSEPVRPNTFNSFSQKLQSIKTEFSKQLEESTNYLSTLLITVKDLREEKNSEKIRSLYKINEELDEMQSFNSTTCA
jgi:hypothetical protein